MTTWDNIIGHEWAVEVLQAALRHDRIGHAYLLAGPEQIGKVTLALTFAQALNCTDPDITRRPCGYCRACTLIAAGHHPDVRLVMGDVSDRGKPSLKIDQIRELQRELNLTPTEARYKVAILPQFEAATPSAANAFLKTLEEPPRQVMLLVTTADADGLLPTIPSRCRTINLRPLPARQIQQALETRWSVPSGEARLLAHLADGRLGWAVQAALEPAILETRLVNIRWLYDALGQNRVGRFATADNLARNPELLPMILRTWLSWWRDLLLLSHNSQFVDPAQSTTAVSITNIDQYDRLSQLAAQIFPDEALAALKKTMSALWQLDHNANTRLALENLLLAYPKPDNSLPIS